jgi:hypothetical protein
MPLNYWLHADPTDGPSRNIISIVKTCFPQSVLCEDFDQLKSNLHNDQQHIVLLIQPTDATKTDTLPQDEWHQRIRKLISTPIQCVWFVEEIYNLIPGNSWACAFPNLLIVTPSQHNFGKNNYPWVTWHHWLQDAVSIYKHPTMQNYINTFDPKNIKPQLFDVLLGGLKPHRTLLHDWIEEDTDLASQTIMTYYGGKTTRPSEILEPGMMISVPVTHFGVGCDFQGVYTRAGIIPPVSVYQQTAYSVVTETTAQHDHVFFTEKIARAIVCQRLFIVLSSYRYLHYLRESGFKTFGNIINESYDLEVNDERRWKMAFNQMQQLAKMDQHWVLEQIQPIVEHNLQVLMHTDWNQKMTVDVNQILNARLDFKKS